MATNPTRIAPPNFNQRNEQQTRSSVETRLKTVESLLENEVRLFKASLTLVNGANSDILLPNVARYLRVTGPSAAFSVTGFTGGYEGKRLILYNPTAFDMTIVNDATSVAANRVHTLTGGNVTVPGNGIAGFIYAVDDLRWILENVSGDDRSYYYAGGTDVAIADGGTGASTAAAAFTNLKQDATTTATGVVELATNTEALAGSDTTRAVTSAGLASSKSLASEGFMALPGGFMMKWGLTGGVSGGTTYSFPVAFPTACFAVVATANSSARIAGVTAFTASGFTYTMNTDSGGASAAQAYYIAFGN